MSDIGLSSVEQDEIASSGLSSGMPDMGSDFDISSFDEAYSPDDFTSREMNFASAVGKQTGGFGDDNTAQTIANFIAQPQVGLNRSNIRDTANFDPTYAAALQISRGLNPGVGSPLERPSYLQPQIPGEFMTTPLGEADMVRPMFFSQGERILQQTIPEIVRSGPVARIAAGIGNFFGDLFSEGKEFAKDATAGIKLPSLKEISEGFTNFVDRFRPQRTVTDTNAMNMPEAAIIREKYDYGDRPLVDVMGQNTFGSMPTNTGIVSVDPRAAQNANRNVAEAIKDLQLVPSEFQDVPTDLGSGIRIVSGSDPNTVRFTTSTGTNLPGLNQLGNVFDMLDVRDLEKEIGNLTGEERDFLAGRTNRIGGISSVRQIQENANKIRQDAIEAYKNPNTRLSNNLTMHIERFKIRNR